MPEEKKYASRYTDKLVTPANHIVEILMERKASKDGKKLVREFWSQAEYRRHYQLNLLQVAKLLNIYSEKAIINALNREVWAWSLGGPKIKQAILEEEAKLARLETQKVVSQKEVSPVKMDENLPTSRPSFGTSKLKGLD